MSEPATERPETGATENKTSETDRGCKPGWIGTLLLALFCSFATATGMLYYYHHHFAPRVIGVDMITYVEDLTAMARSSALSEEESQRALLDLKRIIDDQPARYIVLTSDVLLGGHEMLKLPPLQRQAATKPRAGGRAQ